MTTRRDVYAPFDLGQRVSLACERGQPEATRQVYTVYGFRLTVQEDGTMLEVMCRGRNPYSTITADLIVKPCELEPADPEPPKPAAGDRGPFGAANPPPDPAAEDDLFAGAPAAEAGYERPAGPPPERADLQAMVGRDCMVRIDGEPGLCPGTVSGVADSRPADPVLMVELIKDDGAASLHKLSAVTLG